MLLRPPISTLFPYTTLFRSDQRLTVRVPFRHAVKRRIELHASAERARIGPEAERLVVHVVHRACQEHVELSLKLVSVELQTPPRIDQRGPGIHPVAAISPSRVERRIEPDIDFIHLD